jgi:hypothetical protein
MIKKSLLFVLTLLGILCGLTGCNLEDGQNSISFVTPAIVRGLDIPKNAFTIQTPFAVYAVPSDSKLVLEHVGECALVQLTIDYNNQPSNDFYTATNVTYDIVEQTPLTITNLTNETLITKGYDLPIKEISREQGISNMALLDKYFLNIIHSTPESQRIDYRLACDTTEFNANNHLRTLYLTAKKIEGESTLEKTISRYHAFSIDNLLYYIGEDTIISQNNIKYEYRYLKVNLKYYAGTEGDTIPKWNSFNSAENPIVFAIFKSSN